MIEKRRMLLLLLVISVFVLATGVIYAWVSTVTSSPTATHSGGSPSFCSGSAPHSYSYGNCGTVMWNYYATVFHNGSFLDDDIDSGYRYDGTGSFQRVSSAGGGATAVYSGHYATGSYSSYIADTSTGANMSSSKGSSLYRGTD